MTCIWRFQVNLTQPNFMAIFRFRGPYISLRKRVPNQSFSQAAMLRYISDFLLDWFPSLTMLHFRYAYNDW